VKTRGRNCVDVEAESNHGLAPIAYLPSATLAGADEARLARALAGEDPSALRETWRRFHPLVVRIALAASGSLPAAEALSQRVFRALLAQLASDERLASDQIDGELTPLLLAITVREVRRAGRRARARRWFRLRAGPLPELPVAALDPFSRQALIRFFVLLDRLGPLDRAAFALRFFERREVHEIAAALGSTSARAERRLARVWRKLARIVREDATMADILPTLAPHEEEGDELLA
jgi:DNA-directed RNA polymerase specialized sigma24 family protein